MSGFVLDASVTVAWLVEDEASPETDALMEQARDQGAVAPALWVLEIGNVLLGAERRRRLTAAEVVARIAFLNELPIEIDSGTALPTLTELLALARAERLTSYDATYLELAMRRGLPLATKDAELRAAAKRLGVMLAPS